MVEVFGTLGITAVTTTITTATTTTTVQVEVSHCMELSVGSGIQAIAHLGLTANAGIAARLVQIQVNWAIRIKSSSHNSSGQSSRGEQRV